MNGPSSIPASELLIGKCLNNRFDVKAVLGHGQFSVVYAAEDKTKGAKRIAIKAARHSEDAQESFDAEILILRTCVAAARSWKTTGAGTAQSTLSDLSDGSEAATVALGVLLPSSFEVLVPGGGASASRVGGSIVPSAGSNDFFVFDVVLASDLLPALGKQMAFDAVLRMAMDLLRGLHFLHEGCKVLHMDVKPANIGMVVGADKIERYCLIDLGNATFVNPEEQCLVEQTMPYRSPEVVVGVIPLCVGADLWSLGVVIWEVVTGEQFYPITMEEAQQDGERVQRIRQFGRYVRFFKESIPEGELLEAWAGLGGPQLPDYPRASRDSRAARIAKQLKRVAESTPNNSRLTRLLARMLALQPKERTSAQRLLKELQRDVLEIPSKEARQRPAQTRVEKVLQPATDVQITVGSPLESVPRARGDEGSLDVMKAVFTMLFENPSVIRRTFFEAWKIHVGMDFLMVSTSPRRLVSNELIARGLRTPTRRLSHNAQGETMFGSTLGAWRRLKTKDATDAAADAAAKAEDAATLVHRTEGGYPMSHGANADANVSTDTQYSTEEKPVAEQGRCGRPIVEHLPDSHAAAERASRQGGGRANAQAQTGGASVDAAIASTTMEMQRTGARLPGQDAPKHKRTARTTAVAIGYEEDEGNPK